MHKVLKLQTIQVESNQEGLKGLRKSKLSWWNCGFNSSITMFGC